MNWREPDVAAEAEAQVEQAQPCSCGVVAVAPWRSHDLPWSPASLVFGLLTLIVAVVAIVAAKVLWVGPVIIAVWLAATMTTFLVAHRRAHRGWCLVRRGLWMGIAALGVPLRVVASLPS